MKAFLGLCLYLFGIVSVLIFPISLINYYFDWNITFRGVDALDDPYIGFMLFIIGSIILGGISLWEKLFPAKVGDTEINK